MTASAPSEEFKRAMEILRGRRIAFLTGAGVSTDSGIPDYRGAGAPPRQPMTGPAFLESAERRARYWAGSHLGWGRFHAVSPNDSHRIIAAWEASGRSTGVITQNVDGLHGRAGSSRVSELHGSMTRVRCLRCGQNFDRRALHARIARENPQWNTDDSARLNPDGDAEVHDAGNFVVPTCTVCAGMLKPEVVFFGEFVPGSVFRMASSILRAADVLLIAGSSLAVNSGIRFVEQARRAGQPVIIVNRGETKADARADAKIDGGAAEFFRAADAALSGGSR